MTTGRKEWKETGEELGEAFVNLAKSLVRTGAAGIKEAEEWAEGDDSQTVRGEGGPEKAEESNVFNDGTWRKTGKDLGKALKNLGGTIMGSIERGADKAEEWAADAKETMSDTVQDAAEKAEKRADEIRRDAEEFAEGLKEGTAEDAPVADAEIVSEEIIEDGKE